MRMIEARGIYEASQNEDLWLTFLSLLVLKFAQFLIGALQFAGRNSTQMVVISLEFSIGPKYEK